MKVALIAGCTGLIGSEVLDLLLEDSRYHSIIAISRRPLDSSHEKLKNIVADFSNLAALKQDLVSDEVFCCLGTTIKKAGNQDAFRKVDYEYPVELARVSKEMGAKKYLLVSALGANKNSGIFYNRVKGETEEAILAIDFETLHILRPSLLLGDRKEKRLGEDIGKIFTNVFGWLIPKKYKGISSSKVAHAMIELANETTTGNHVHESDSLQDNQLT